MALNTYHDHAGQAAPLDFCLVPEALFHLNRQQQCADASGAPKGMGDSAQGGLRFFSLLWIAPAPSSSQTWPHLSHPKVQPLLPWETPRFRHEPEKRR